VAIGEYIDHIELYIQSRCGGEGERPPSRLFRLLHSLHLASATLLAEPLEIPSVPERNCEQLTDEIA
jgi:hypothetical protein